MAHGFINQFYEVPDFWKIYVHEVDQEREMWLNSFYKSPLRLPMPAELEYWWSKNHDPEFVLINKEREPDPNDPSKLIYTEAPFILHVPSGLIINYIEDEKHGIRLFWRPPLKEGEEVDPSKAVPLGFDEFYGEEASDEMDGLWSRLVKSVEKMYNPVVEKIEKWAEEKNKSSETKAKLIEQQLELVEAEICLEEANEELDEELKLKEKQEQRKAEMGLSEEDEIDDTAKEIPTTLIAEENRRALEQNEEGKEAEEEDDDDEPDDRASSFGTTVLSQGGETRKFTVFCHLLVSYTVQSSLLCRFLHISLGPVVEGKGFVWM